MGDKYKIKKDDLKALFATVEILSENHYHQLYEKLGWKKGANGNFHCWNGEAHGKGVDTHPSLSVDNRTGKWHCFACGIKGNLQSYWTENIKGPNCDSYTDWVIDFLGIAASASIKFSTSTTDPDYEKNCQELRTLSEMLQNERFKSTGKRHILSGELLEFAKQAITIPKAEIDGYVEKLLNSPVDLAYLYETRKITPEEIKKYRLGVNDRGKFIFPVINAEGDCINIKAYDPRGNPDYKWSYPYKGYQNGPVPINNFTHQVIYFFGGEPDTYCANAFGINGVTFGSEAITDVDRVFGQERARQIFMGKEIVICLDSDEAGIIAAGKLAKSLYPYAKQIKIVNLDKSETNPYGLDPNLVKEITVGDKKKIKRIEKDFTDYMKKNGFNDTAKLRFEKLVESLMVYTQNLDRTKKEIFKVTIQECRMPKYFSNGGTRAVELIASVSDFNCNALLYPKQVVVECLHMGCSMEKKKMGMCANCMLPTLPNFETEHSLTFNFVREIPKEYTNDRSYIKITEHDILGLIEVTHKQKVQQQMDLCGINSRCNSVVIGEGSVPPGKLLHVRLSKDVNEYGESQKSVNTGGAQIDIEAYMDGEDDIYPNRSYKFEAFQTQAWDGQEAVLFIYKAEPIATCIETFKMDEATHEILQVFRPKANETLKEHIKRRHDIFANAAGVSGRRELFLINDLTFFSPLEIHNKKLLPAITRGWLESIIAGDTRTCKTMVSRFLHNHYKIGDFIIGSSAVTRSGLLGGMTSFNNKNGISWGKIPMNDGGLVIIDELSNITESTLTDLTGCRSDGIASIDGIVSGRMVARTRKIMLSNKRTWKSEDVKSPTYGIQFLKDLCFKDEILARFDIGFVVREDDVDVKEFSASYEAIATEFTEFQCQTLIRWVYSRKPEDIIFEEGFEEKINEAQIEMMQRYHSSTQLVNQEMRAKLVRLSVSVASMVYSIPDDDWNKIFVKKEHIDFIVEFLNYLYCHKNMRLDDYSKMKYKKEKLGDMSFMENICKYIDVEELVHEEEFTDKHIQQVFYDYLERVQTRLVSIPDAKTDQSTSTGLKIFEALPKLIGLLTSRNCFSRTKKGTYRKTIQFNNWLTKRLELGDNAQTSNILEYSAAQSNAKINQEARKAFGAS